MYNINRQTNPHEYQFFPDENCFSKLYALRSPRCGKALVHKKDLKHVIVHKCMNPKYPYYLHNLKKVDKKHLEKDYGKYEYNLHYIYHEFTINFFQMDAAKRSINGYQVSITVVQAPASWQCAWPSITSKNFQKNFRFIADGYSAYPLAAQQFLHEFGNAFQFNITWVIRLINDDAVSKEFHPFKQMIERLNHAYKAFYQKTNGFDNIEGLGKTQFQVKGQVACGFLRQSSEPRRAYCLIYLQFSRFI